MFGFQFENLVLNNLKTLFPMLGLETSLVLSAAPYFQRPAAGRYFDFIVPFDRFFET